jgi:outer membrane protein assembly factor BamE
MQKPFISLVCVASLALISCTSTGPAGDNAPQSSILERIPIVYRQDIQQGNVLTQDAVNQLRPGLSKRQVRFIMGTPMLMDTFHQDRWDYLYTMTEGWGTTQKKQVHLYFNGDQLDRIEGDLKPVLGAANDQVKKDVVISVPDYRDPNRGIIEKAVDHVTDFWKERHPPAPPVSPR